MKQSPVWDKREVNLALTIEEAINEPPSTEMEEDFEFFELKKLSQIYNLVRNNRDDL